MDTMYVIEHVLGDANAWGDLSSRWGAVAILPTDLAARRVARLAVVERVSPPSLYRRQKPRSALSIKIKIPATKGKRELPVRTGITSVH
ncbi:uncharacterized protein IUM83_02013 [Phytophthora cinnamomi]|uniref:uncharacterized protein n=1 Tax=Phytophthora cinnamomi TaxID=4785 RepID=UPI0035598967|nr:hypothetical protein IUM83_02013 [Phytophthora cinnamomi]